MMHFARADEDDGIGEPLAVFEAACRGLPYPRSLANSAGVVRYAEVGGDIVRPGIMLYGATPFPYDTAEMLGLQPVMTLRSEIIAVQDARSRTRASATAARTRRRARTASASSPCGYADGYPRHAPNGTPVLVLRQEGAPRRPRVDGHDHRGPDRRSRGARRQPGRAVGRGPAGRRRRERRVDGRLRAAVRASRRACRVVATRGRAASTSSYERRSGHARRRVHRRHRRRRLHRREPRARRSTRAARRDIIAVDNLDARRQVRATSSTARSPTTSTRTSSSRASPTATSTTTSRAILHQGACSDTMETDGRYMMRNNYRYSVRAARPLPEQRRSVPVRVERGGVRRRHARSARSASTRRRSTSTATRSSCSTSTCAAMLPERTAPIVGFRYFNVYGPREQHKGRMASVALAFLRPVPRRRPRAAVRGLGRLSPHGEQRRDFVCGRRRRRGQPRFPRSPGALAASSTSAPGSAQTLQRDGRGDDQRVPRGATASRRATLAELVAAGAIEYIPLPAALVGKYQSFTEADLTRAARRRLRGADSRRSQEGVAALRRTADGATT